MNFKEQWNYPARREQNTQMQRSIWKRELQKSTKKSENSATQIGRSIEQLTSERFIFILIINMTLMEKWVKPEGIVLTCPKSEVERQNRSKSQIKSKSQQMLDSDYRTEVTTGVWMGIERAERSSEL